MLHVYKYVLNLLNDTYELILRLTDNTNVDLINKTRIHSTEQLPEWTNSPNVFRSNIREHH